MAKLVWWISPSKGIFYHKKFIFLHIIAICQGVSNTHNEQGNPADNDTKQTLHEEKNNHNADSSNCGSGMHHNISPNQAHGRDRPF